MNFFAFDISYFRCYENVFLGVFHGILFSFPFSTPILICIRHFLLDGKRKGSAAILGSILGQLSFSFLLIFGVRPIIQLWYSLEPFLAVLGVSLLFKRSTNFYYTVENRFDLLASSNEAQSFSIGKLGVAKPNIGEPRVVGEAIPRSAGFTTKSKTTPGNGSTYSDFPAKSGENVIRRNLRWWFYYYNLVLGAFKKIKWQASTFVFALATRIRVSVLPNYRRHYSTLSNDLATPSTSSKMQSLPPSGSTWDAPMKTSNDLSLQNIFCFQFLLMFLNPVCSATLAKVFFGQDLLEICNLSYLSAQSTLSCASASLGSANDLLMTGQQSLLGFALATPTTESRQMTKLFSALPGLAFRFQNNSQVEYLLSFLVSSWSSCLLFSTCIFTLISGSKIIFFLFTHSFKESYSWLRTTYSFVESGVTKISDVVNGRRDNKFPALRNSASVAYSTNSTMAKPAPIPSTESNPLLRKTNSFAVFNVFLAIKTYISKLKIKNFSIFERSYSPRSDSPQSGVRWRSQVKPKEINKIFVFCILGCAIQGSLQYTWRLFTQYPLEFLPSLTQLAFPSSTKPSKLLSLPPAYANSDSVGANPAERGITELPKDDLSRQMLPSSFGMAPAIFDKVEGLVIQQSRISPSTSSKMPTEYISDAGRTPSVGVGSANDQLKPNGIRNEESDTNENLNQQNPRPGLREFPSFDTNIRYREKNLPVERHLPIERMNARRSLSGRAPFNEEQKSDAYLKYTSFFLNSLEKQWEDLKISVQDQPTKTYLQGFDLLSTDLNQNSTKSSAEPTPSLFSTLSGGVISTESLAKPSAQLKRYSTPSNSLSKQHGVRVGSAEMLDPIQFVRQDLSKTPFELGAGSAYSGGDLGSATQSGMTLPKEKVEIKPIQFAFAEQQPSRVPKNKNKFFNLFSNFEFFKKTKKLYLELKYLEKLKNEYDQISILGPDSTESVGFAYSTESKQSTEQRKIIPSLHEENITKGKPKLSYLRNLSFVSSNSSELEKKQFLHDDLSMYNDFFRHVTR